MINYCLDTNIILNGLSKFIEDKSNCGVIIPLTVVSELENQKTREGEIGYKARKSIRDLYEIKKYGNINDWIKLPNNVSIKVEQGIDYELELDYDIKDDYIIGTLSLCNTTYGNTTLVSNDLAMCLKAEGLGFKSEQFNINVNIYDNLYTGKLDILVEDRVIDDFYNNENINTEDINIIPYQNQFIIMTSNCNSKKKAVAVYKGNSFTKLKYSDCQPAKLKPRNLEQKLAIELLMDDSIPMVSLTGVAGSSKTILALAVCLEKLNDNSNPYNKIVIAKPPIALDKNLHVGYKKGSTFEKHKDTLGSISSNLEVLREDKANRFMTGTKLLEGYLDQNLFEICSLEDILGSSYNNCIVLADEMQLLTKENMFSLLSRIGNSRLFITGDLMQGSRLIKTAPIEMGLYKTVESFKDSELSGHLKLETIQRSKFVEELYKLW